MKTVVISGINIVDGGAKSVYDDLLDTIVKNRLYENEKFIILVSKKELFKKYTPFFEIIEFPKSKISWLNRIYYEYFYFKKLSKRIKPDIWLSMHDITPNVIAKRQYVYCHNPSPFYNMKFKDAKYGWKYYLFSKFYKYLYKININKNNAVIVQQQWMARSFDKMYNIKNIYVAKPSLKIGEIAPSNITSSKVYFIYPSFPRPFKNFETLCEAVKILNKKNLQKEFEVDITLNGTENAYSKMLFKKYGAEPNINFIGLQSRKQLFKNYSKSNCLIFISNLETWGMPISEYKQTSKPIITSDLPYAHETVGNYRNAKFIEKNNSEQLAQNMADVINGNKFHSEFKLKCNKTYHEFNSWDSLIKEIF